jgi:hypothetical protein
VPNLPTPVDPLEIPLPPELRMVGDATQDPIVASLVENIEADLDPTPDFSSPGSQNVTLPTGLLRGDTLITHAKVRELTGEDEESIYREFNKEEVITPHSFLNLVLKQCILEIGEDAPSPNDLKQLLIGDRTYLALRIRELTYGPDWEVESFICRLCGETFSVVVELQDGGDIKVKTLDDPSRQIINVPLRKGFAQVRLVNGADEDLANSFTDIPAQKTSIINSCLISIDGNPVKNVAKSMGLKDRDAIIAALGASAPGPRLGEVSVPCDKCGRSADYAINLADLFLV